MLNYYNYEYLLVNFLRTDVIIYVLSSIVLPIIIAYYTTKFSLNNFFATKYLESLDKLFEQLNNTSIYFAGLGDNGKQNNCSISILQMESFISLAAWHDNNYRKYGKDLNYRPISLSVPLYKMTDFNIYISNMNLKRKQRKLIENLCFFNDSITDAKNPKIKSRMRFHILNEPLIDHDENFRKTPQYRDLEYLDIPIESCGNFGEYINRWRYLYIYICICRKYSISYDLQLLKIRILILYYKLHSKYFG